MKKFNVGIKGIIRREDGAVLLLKKNKEHSFWEVPGGRIDSDESIEQTLKRELEEELPGSKDMQIFRIVCAHRLNKDIGDDLGLMLIYFEIKLALPDPINISDEHSEFTWVKTTDEIDLDGGTLEALNKVFS